MALLQYPAKIGTTHLPNVEMNLNGASQVKPDSSTAAKYIELKLSKRVLSDKNKY